MSKNEEVGFASALRAAVERVPSQSLWRHTDEDDDQAYLRRDDNGWALVVSQRLSDRTRPSNGRVVHVDRPALLALFHAIGDELAITAPAAVGTAGGGQPNASDLGSVETQKGNTE